MGRGWIGSSWKPSAAELNEAAASQECSPAPAVSCKEGFEDSRDQSPAAGMREDEDDVGAQKRRAQVSQWTLCWQGAAQRQGGCGATPWGQIVNNIILVAG